MADFKGLPKEEHDKLKRAVAAYERITGEHVDIGSIPVLDAKGESPEEKAKRAQQELDTQAEIARLKETADQASRKLAVGRGGEVQDENPGPGQPAMVTERAKAQGVSRKGEEPDIAKPSRR